MKQIYLDNAATTPVDREVLSTMLPYFSDKFGNPMSLHSFGREALEAMEDARRRAADFFGANPDEIVFTSGATESNNLAVKGVIAYHCAKAPAAGKPHIITSSFEHHCVLNACQEVERQGLAEVTYVRPEKNGIVSVEKIRKAIKPSTVLISIMYVNNEIGTIQPISEIGKLVRKINAERNKKLRTASRKLSLHTDATQAVNYLDCDVDRLGVDMLSMSGHKIYGPKGVGCLYVRKGTPLRQIQSGGDQENGKRSGTHNVPGIVGLGKALSMIGRQKTKNSQKMSGLRDYLIKNVIRQIPDSWLNGDKKRRTPNNANFSFRNVEGEALILMLDSSGIAASTGSACSSGSLEPSHVLLSLGLKPEEAHGSLRITLGKNTTKKDIDYVIRTLKKVVTDLRKISGNVLDEYYNKNN